MSIYLENTVHLELREIHETVRWLLIALLAVFGLPQLSVWWDRNRTQAGMEIEFRQVFRLRWSPRLGCWAFLPSPPLLRGKSSPKKRGGANL